MDEFCPVCYDEFDLSEKQPRIWPTCGHSLCEACLYTLIEDQQTSKCPLDKSKITHDSDISKFPVNFALKGLLEKAQKKLCAEHGNEIISFCVTDKRKICAECFENKHRKHQTRALKTIRKQTDDQRKQINNLREEVLETYQEMKDKIEDERNSQYDKIDSDYNDQIQFLNYKRLCLKSQANLLLRLEERKVDDLLGRESSLFNGLSAEGETLQKMKKEEELFRYNDKFPKKFKILSNQYDLIMTSSLHQGDIHELFKNVFCQQQRVFSQAKTKVENFFALSVLQSCLDFDYNGSCLDITTVRDIPKEAKIDLKKWAKAQEVKFLFDRVVSQEDLELLTLIWDNLKNPSSLSITIQDQNLTQELCDVFCSGRHQFKSVLLDITGCKIDENSLMIPFVRNIFLKAKNIQTVSIIMEEIEAADGSISKIFENNIFDTSKIKEFSLNLDQAEKVSDKDISHIFVSMPKLQKFKLWLPGKKITDKTLISCAQNTLTSAVDLKELNFSIMDGKITDTGVKRLYSSLTEKKLIDLRLYLEDAQLTDKSVKCLSKAMLAGGFYGSLKVFHLRLSYNKISGQSLISFFKPMSNIRKFNLDLDNTEVTDKAIYQLIKQSLASMKSLDILELGLSNTSITSDCFGKLLKKLNDAKCIELTLENTKIKGKTLELFAKNKLSPQSICKKLHIDFNETDISRGMRQKIEKTIKDVLKKK